MLALRYLQEANEIQLRALSGEDILCMSRKHFRQIYGAQFKPTGSDVNQLDNSGFNDFHTSAFLMLMICKEVH